MDRPQRKPQPNPAQPGLKVVDTPPAKQHAMPDPTEDVPAGQDNTSAPSGTSAIDEREAETARRRRLHPPRVWPD